MDYSHLHTYAPPQHVPENTGYTYALSSSYSSAALDFENLHKLDPVFDSPRMSRRSLRLTTTSFPDDRHNESIASNISYSGGVSDRSLSRSFRQQHNTSRQSSSSHHRSASLKAASNTSLQSSFSSHLSDASMLSNMLDESSIREQTEVNNLWGLDDDDPKAGDTTVIQANGDVLSAETQTTLINGYTCSDCSMLSDRSNVLTAFSATRSPASSTYTTSNKVYTQNRSQKHKSTHSSYCGSMNVAEYQTEDRHLHINGESICDDCKGTKRETHITTVHTQSSSWAKRVTGKLWHIFSYTGYYLMQAARSIGAAGWFVSRKVLSFLWLAIVSPGKAASGIFWWLGTGWYQLTTLVSLLNVFLLTRCLPKAFRLLLLLIPLLLLLGLWWWGFDTLLAMLPALSGFTLYSTQTEDPIPSLKPMSDIYVSSDHEKKELNLQFDDRMKALEKNFGLMTAHHDYHLEDYKKLKVLVVDIREQMGQMSDKGHTSSVIASLLDERFAKMKLDLHEKTTDENSINKNHEARILHLESLLTKLSEAIEEDRRRAQTNTSEGQIQDQSLLRRRIESLEREFAEYKGEFLKGQMAKSSCDLPDCVLQKVDARVRESVQMMFGSQADLPESLLQWLSTNYVSNVDLGTRLQKLELQILRSITHQISITKKVPTAKVVEGAVIGSVSGITEEDARVLVNNALKLYSQDRTGMVDFALESGGGSILGTRCSETYGTKTALLSLFGIPLWYLSQSPRVVIQPDMYPGNCWAFKGAQGFLVVRLSMAILPTAFSLEHISKSLSPTGNITSAPKDFAVYGLENEYQEDGTLLVQSIYDEEGEPLQTFYVMVENEKPFQIVELRILSNWGHADYTCLYRFRAHGTPMK
ncbi:SUN domain-containing protein 1 isoform X3 [Rana temporaria]|uniref:SUN domain-containing protein 1 isoform X3 n=1 Tax=Rana temporaria TaxID=8407 RepID=UPI001AACC079|nr:SUN domain-containing protein 1 isoform X3 [Rana temporaria]